jgi:hypothetical protein
MECDEKYNAIKAAIAQVEGSYCSPNFVFFTKKVPNWAMAILKNKMVANRLRKAVCV